MLGTEQCQLAAGGGGGEGGGVGAPPLISCFQFRDLLHQQDFFQ